MGLAAVVADYNTSDVAGGDDVVVVDVEDFDVAVVVGDS